MSDTTLPRPVPRLDGLAADRLTLTFGGTIDLDRADDHLRLLEAMSLGQDIDLQVTCRVSSKGFVHALKTKSNADDVDAVTFTAKVKVIDILSRQVIGAWRGCCAREHPRRA